MVNVIHMLHCLFAEYEKNFRKEKITWRLPGSFETKSHNGQNRWTKLNPKLLVRFLPNLAQMSIKRLRKQSALTSFGNPEIWGRGAGVNFRNTLFYKFWTVCSKLGTFGDKDREEACIEMHLILYLLSLIGSEIPIFMGNAHFYGHSRADEEDKRGIWLNNSSNNFVL